MPKVQSLKAKADYRGPGCKGKFYTTNVQIDWDGPVLHYRDGLFWKKLAFKDVVEWHVVFEPGGKPDKFGRLKILHIIKLRTQTEMREFALPPEVFENWLYWIIRSLVKHAKISLSKEEIKQSPLLAKHKFKTNLFQNVSVFDRTHQMFVNTLNILHKHKNLPSNFDTGEGGAKFGRIVKKIGSGGSDTIIFEIMQKLDPIKAGEEAGEEPVAVKVAGTDITTKKEVMTELIKEARVLALLGRHPNIVGLVDTALAENRLCLFMEMGTGDLTHLDKDTLTKHLVITYTRGILAGIAHMHNCRIYHLDMKPQNVIICKGGFAKIIDFGLTRGTMLHSKKERFEAPGHWASMGTNGYISPEAWDWGTSDITSEIDLAKRDSYAVGMTIINGLLGPFLGMAEVKVEFGEQQQHVLNRIETWKKRLRDEKISESLRKQGLSDLTEAVIGLIEEDPQQRWTIEQAAEFLQADRKKLRRKHVSDSHDALKAFKTSMKEYDYLKEKLKKSTE
ncbi:MAG: protein kinase [Syntrophaceae bacterium]